MSVVSNIADQARTMLESAGVACWAFDTEGRISATRGSGDPAAESVLSWAGLNSEDSWREAPTGVLSGSANGQAWSLIPLWYGDRLVGAIGSGHAPTQPAQPPALDLPRPAAGGHPNPPAPAPGPRRKPPPGEGAGVHPVAPPPA